MNNKIYKIDNPTDEFIKVKHRGKIYTPDYLVSDILNQGHYVKDKINKKHVIDNSCGDGQFLIQIIDRYCKDYLSKNTNIKELKKELETYIHGIEIDDNELNICVKRCNEVAKLYGVKNVKWDFIHNDTMKISKYNNKMDFVLGNPPYVRVHNLNDNFNSVKNRKFSNGGMTDLFIVFYEIGIEMLNRSGILCYITPSSFFTSLAGNSLRNYLIANKCFESVCDLKHFQPFNAITYTTIVCINKKHNSNNIKYYIFDEKGLKQKFVESLNINTCNINGSFYFSNNKNLALLKNILENNKKCKIEIKNGYATLCDKVFVNDFDFDSKFIISVIKGSRGKWTKIIYPYDENGKLYSEAELKKDKKVYKHLLNNKSLLLKKDNEKGNEYWYAFGRSQAINDTYSNKLSINTLIKDANDLKIFDVPSGSGVYSGLYILCNGINPKKIRSALVSNDFSIYISLLGKYKSGGYYTFSTKDIKAYLDYKLGR